MGDNTVNENVSANVLKLIIKSGSIMEEIGKHHPIIKRYLYLELDATLKLLRAKNCLHLYRIQYDFKVPYDGNHPQKTWASYKEIIKANIGYLCQNLMTENNISLLEYFAPAKEHLASTIHEKYYDVLPYWPNVNHVNKAAIDLDIKSSYIYGGYYVIWSCLGSLLVTDKRPYSDCFQACFEGRPDIKCVVLDKPALDAVERSLKVLSEEKQLEAIRKYQDATEIKWDDLTIDLFSN